MSYTMASFYLFMKLAFFYSLVRVQVKFEPMKDHWLFLAALYTAGIAFLSYVFIFGWQNVQMAPLHVRLGQILGVSPWVAWVGETFVLSLLYFRLLAKFDEGVIFWTLLLLGLLVVWF
jgi:hypothetical protein